MSIGPRGQAGGKDWGPVALGAEHGYGQRRKGMDRVNLGAHPAPVREASVLSHLP